MNGYIFDRHEEEQSVDLFAKQIYNAGLSFLENPDHGSFIPSWKRVMSAIPGYLEQFYEAVEKDNDIL
jgi:glucosyl-3-phosphoglycerate synthase